jgi:hypothetical protein
VSAEDFAIGANIEFGNETICPKDPYGENLEMKIAFLQSKKAIKQCAISKLAHFHPVAGGTKLD